MKRIIIGFMVAAFAISASAQELNVASFNIRNGRVLSEKNRAKSRSELRGDYKNYNGWEDRREILCDMINFEAFDVFGAQEVRKGQLDYMLQQLPDYDYVGVGRDDGKTKGEYSPVFYRKDKIEKLDGGTFWLSPTPNVPSKGWDAKYKRICSWGLFRHKESGKRFYFLNVHFDHRGVQARIEASKQLVEFVNRVCKGTSAIVTGDFNVTQLSDSYKVLSESKVLKDSYKVAKYRFAPTGTFNGFNSRCYTDHRIDHIFVTKKLKVSRYGVLTYHYYFDKYAAEGKVAPADISAENREVKCISDHYAVQVFLDLK